MKLMIGLFIGLLLGGALFMGPLKPMGTNGQVEAVASETQQISKATNVAYSSNTTTDSINYSGSQEVSSGTVKQMLQDARSQIQNPDTAQYYDKLIAAYDLDDTNPDQSTNGSGVLSSITDIQKINYAAVSTPLIEAGKNIKDPDIAKFYYKLLQDTGWDIKP